MAKIKRFFECLIPVSVCNLKCDYCYIIQRKHDKQIVPELDYSPEIIGQALTQERLGGVCYFSICGAGETFVPDYLIDILYQLLKNGHYVNVTTNGTLTNRMKRLKELPEEWLERLHISFSFHYLELKRLNLIDTFFNNVDFVKNLGCSFIVQINLYDGYITCLEEIKEICIKRVGAMPQVAVTRKEESLMKKIEIMTEGTVEEYKAVAQPMQSPLFDFTMKNFNVKRNEFCYAGDWSYVLNLKTGILKRCYASSVYQNIFKDVNKPLKQMAVGKCCTSLYCLNSSHFMSLGVIPEADAPTYAELRNREEAHWYSDSMKEFLGSKLGESNKAYSKVRKICSNIVGLFDNLLYKSYRLARKLLKR